MSTLKRFRTTNVFNPGLNKNNNNFETKAFSPKRIQPLKYKTGNATLNPIPYDIFFSRLPWRREGVPLNGKSTSECLSPILFPMFPFYTGRWQDVTNVQCVACGKTFKLSNCDWSMWISLFILLGSHWSE